MPENTDTKQYVLKFLQSENLGTLATVNENCQPDAASIYYVIDNNFEISFVTKKSTGKFQNILNRKEVVFTVTNRDKQETVKIRGTAAPLDGDPMKIGKIITGITGSKNFSAYADKVIPILKLKGEAMVAVRIKPSEIRISIYRKENVRQETIRFGKK